MRQREVGVQLIVAYKAVKAVVQLVMGVGLLVFAPRVANDLDHLVRDVRDHASAAWSLALAHALARLVTRRHVVVVAVAAVLDAFVSAFEGWALHHRYWWSEWLIVAATSFLLPFEVVAFVHHPAALRAIVFVVNVTIVAYLAWHIARRRRSGEHSRRGRSGDRQAGPHATRA